jgi:hypothetical protein
MEGFGPVAKIAIPFMSISATIFQDAGLVPPESGRDGLVA